MMRLINNTYIFFLSVWIFASVLLKCDGIIVGSKGKDFVLTLLQETSPGLTSIQISSDVTTHVTIEAPFIGLSKTVLVSPGVTEVGIGSALRESSAQISFKGIRVKSDEPISIYIIDDTNPNVGGYLALPVDSLATEYMVMSFNPQHRSEFLITSASDRTKVSVTIKSKTNVTYLGQTYRNGEVIREILDTFQTWQINSDSDLTGTIIKSDGKVAVISGSDCAHVPENSASCDYIVEQLPTITAWETTFIVPLIKVCYNVIRILSRDDDTNVKVTFDQRAWSTKLNSTEFVDQTYSLVGTNKDPVVVIEASRPILVTLLIGSGSSATASNACGPSMSIVPAISQYYNTFRMRINSGLSMGILSIIVPAAKLSGVQINNQSVAAMSQSHVFAGSSNSDFYVLEVDVSTFNADLQINHQENIDIGVIFHGGRQNETFGLPLGMSMDLSNANEVIRLVGGTSQSSGRVEVLHRGNWGTICNVSFDANDANVVCRILGFYFGAASPAFGGYGPGTGIIMVDNLQCDGTEVDLHLCKSGTWESSHCSHTQDAGVDCGTQVRLIGTGDPREGRVEVLYGSQWGTVCDDNFGRNEASVLCSSMGYGRVGYFYTGGGGSGNQWLDDLDCTGQEADIAQCMSKNWGVTDCSHNEDVWLACYPQTNIRLTGGSSPAEGRLEVMLQNQWHSVCDHMFNDQDASVVCNMLGYKRTGEDATVRVYPGAHFGQGLGQVAIDELNCTGTEQDIAECQSRPWLVNSCSHLHDVGLSCGSHVRLANGTSTTSGRLEVFYKGHWGTVCDDHFGSNDAKVVCKQLAYPYWSGWSSVQSYGLGTGRIVVDELRCHGTETDISQCPSNSWLSSDCSHGEDVGVNCGTALRLVQGSSPTEGRVEVYYGGQWGTVCSDNFDNSDASVICRQLGYTFDNIRIHKNGYYGAGHGPIVIDELVCSGSESDVQFCSSSPWLTHDCTHAQDVGIDCGLRLNDAVAASCSPAGWDIRIDMQKLNRVFPGSVFSDVVLNPNDLCLGTLNGQQLRFQYGLRTCSTREQTLVSSNVYTNEIVYAFHDPINHSIIRNLNWTLTLNCAIDRNGVANINIAQPSNNNTGGSIDTTAQYNVQYGFYRDAAYSQKLPDNNIRLAVNTDVYVKIFTADADGATKMIVQTCYATPTSNKNDPQKFFLIQNMCRRDSSVQILRTTGHEFDFKFTVFKFGNSHDDLYIHCQEKFCASTDFSNPCTQVCHEH